MRNKFVIGGLVTGTNETAEHLKSRVWVLERMDRDGFVVIRDRNSTNQQPYFLMVHSSNLKVCVSRKQRASWHRDGF